MDDYDGKQFVVSSGNPIKLKDLADVFEKVIGKKLNINWGAREYRSREVMIPYNQGTLVPGWEPKKTVEEGIRELFK